MSAAAAMLQRVYARMKAHYLDSLGYVVPERYRSSFVHWGGGSEVQYIYRRFTEDLPPGAKVLIVGAMGGRDYFLFRNFGFDVSALDLGPQPDIANVVIGNAEEPLPFPDGSFDVVLAGEIIEHLERDVTALRNVRRVLKDTGRLIVSVPYYNDWEPGHVRIHSPQSFGTVLGLAGFEVSDYLERPALIRPNRLNLIQHGMSLALFVLGGRTAYGFTSRLMGSFSWRVGHVGWLRPIRRLSKSYGGYFLCVKGTATDHVAVNRARYTAAMAARELQK